MISTITINGKTFTANGNGNISVYNNKVYIDGNLVECINTINEIIITGDCGAIHCDGSVKVEGNVYGNIDCGGSCKCGNVSGDVDAGGSITCENVQGSIDAGGSIRMKK